MSSESTRKTREFTGFHMLAVMVGFFGVVIAVNLTLAWFANSSWSGLVVKNSYVASQHFNATLADADRQKLLGWSLKTGYRNGTLLVEVRDRDGKMLRDAQVTVHLGRPATDRFDKEIRLQPTADGAFAGAADLAPGQWLTEVAVEDETGQKLRLEGRLFVRQGVANP